MKPRRKDVRDTLNRFEKIVGIIIMIKGILKKPVYLCDTKVIVSELKMEHFDELIDFLIGSKIPDMTEFVNYLLKPETLLKVLKTKGKIKEFMELVLKEEFGKGILQEVEYNNIPLRQTIEFFEVFFSLNRYSINTLQMLLAKSIAKIMEILATQEIGLTDLLKNKTNPD